jgi:N-acyl-L-homoserine lactone synthetase
MFVTVTQTRVVDQLAGRGWQVLLIGEKSEVGDDDESVCTTLKLSEL